MLTREELKSSAAIYFKDTNLSEIHGTQDKQFFYTEDEAAMYCAGKIQHFKYTRDEFGEKPIEEVEVKLTPKQQKQQDAKDLQIDFTEETTSKQLDKLIEDKKLDNAKLQAIDLDIDVDDNVTIEELTEMIAEKTEG